MDILNRRCLIRRQKRRTYTLKDADPKIKLGHSHSRSPMFANLLLLHNSCSCAGTPPDGDTLQLIIPLTWLGVWWGGSVGILCCVCWRGNVPERAAFTGVSRKTASWERDFGGDGVASTCARSRTRALSNPGSSSTRTRPASPRHERSDIMRNMPLFFLSFFLFWETSPVVVDKSYPFSRPLNAAQVCLSAGGRRDQPPHKDSLFPLK